jgi:hypothetical protein
VTSKNLKLFLQALRLKAEKGMILISALIGVITNNGIVLKLFFTKNFFKTNRGEAIKKSHRSINKNPADYETLYYFFISYLHISCNALRTERHTNH